MEYCLGEISALRTTLGPARIKPLRKDGLCTGKPLLEPPGSELSEERLTDVASAMSVPWHLAPEELEV